MISDHRELQTTSDRLTRLQAQVIHMSRTESYLINLRACTSGFLAEIDRMQSEVRKYLGMSSQN